jgi:tetratricopeptide (TPR) repeat protein
MNIITRLGLALCAALLLAVTAGATPARADWLKAETPNFIIYSDGGERPLREYAMKLEVFDRFLRMRFGVPLDRPVARKLPIYLVRRQGDLARVQPGIGESIAGFYYPGEEDIFAVAVRGDGESTLLHEYAHHFFFQHFSAYYPGWLVEGLAEYVSTARIWPDRIQVGAHDEGRASWLTNVQWLPMDVLLSSRFGEIERGIHQATYYPVSWLLTHWFMSSPERVVKLEAYLGLIRQGVDPSTAMQQATGLTLDQLRNTLRDHLYGRIELNTYDIDLEIQVEISRMPPSADDLLLLGQRLKVPMSKENREAALEETRRLAGRYPDDPLALLVLGHAELHIGDRAAGEAAFTRLLEMEPDNVEALQFMAMARIEDAADRPDERTDLMNRARGYLATAYGVDPGNYLTLLLIARSRDGAPGYPNDNDLATWEMAFIAAPQLSGIRLGAGHAFLAAGDKATAIALLEPLANAPHGGEGAESAQRLIDQANGVVREDSDEAEPAAEAAAAD